MRTTISLDVRLLKRAREQAQKAGVTLSDLVAAALRRELDQPRRRSAVKPFRLVTFGGGALAPGYDWGKLEDQTFPYPKAGEGEGAGR